MLITQMLMTVISTHLPIIQAVVLLLSIVFADQNKSGTEHENAQPL